MSDRVIYLARSRYGLRNYKIGCSIDPRKRTSRINCDLIATSQPGATYADETWALDQARSMAVRLWRHGSNHNIGTRLTETEYFVADAHGVLRLRTLVETMEVGRTESDAYGKRTVTKPFTQAELDEEAVYQHLRKNNPALLDEILAGNTNTPEVAA